MAETSGAERILPGGWEQDRLTERGGVIYRASGPQSPAVIGLLRHLETVDFPAAPRVVGSGFDDSGRETLTFIEGEIQGQLPWSEDALAALGGLIRQLHDATRSLPARPAPWRTTFARSLPTDDLVIGHGDLGPWNIVSHKGLPIGFIDWDTAGPAGATWDLAYVAWLNVQLYDDDVAAARGLGDAAARGRRLRIFLDAYGLPPDKRDGFVAQIAEVAIHEAREEAVKAGVTAESTSGVLENGYPIVWAVTWRARSASWILANRTVLTAAIL